jgi:hypothetical protein
MSDPIFLAGYLLNSAAWFLAGIGVGTLWKELHDEIHDR